VFNDEWVLVAVHHSAEQAEDSQGRPIDVNGNPVTSETPDHLRDWIANAGIRVSRIVDHLRTLALVGEQAQLLAAVLRP
jgi:endonuclease G